MLHAVIAFVGCGQRATPNGATILDWHRTSGVTLGAASLGDDIGPASEETQSGTMAVGTDTIRYTIRMELGRMRGRGAEIPSIVRGPRRIRIRIDESRGHLVTASCDDELVPTSVPGELAAICRLAVGTDAVKVFMLGPLADGPSTRAGG